MEESSFKSEREYTARVQQLLYAVIRQYKSYAQFHDESIRMILSDAWDELRMKPTALSPQDLEQLSTEIDRTLARKAFTAEIALRYERMLLNPFFARIDFREDGADYTEKIVIGLYSLKNEKGELLVHDWRAPVCSVYYNAMPGVVSYESPSGVITGRMTLKRQYRMEKGRLKYYVDTDVNIEDDMLLDILSRATSRHMRTIVSSIQRDQNEAIRRENAKVLTVVGGAGSGKTSVAMHRAAYLMYRQRNLLDASKIAVLSPDNAFSEYISTVLPDLGEENVQAVTLRSIFSKTIGLACESPAKQVERMLCDPTSKLRMESANYKSGMAFANHLEQFADDFRNRGPAFETVCLQKHVLASQEELEKLYRVDFRLLSPALRLIRINTVLTSRLEQWEYALKQQYEDRLHKAYGGRDLDLAVRMAISQQLRPVRASMKKMFDVDALTLYARALENAPEAIARAARENAQARVVWWEDAGGIAWLMLKLGFVDPDKNILHLLIDEAQDYPIVALKALKLIYPSAHATILGDPNQLTSPGMLSCDPTAWGACFGVPDAPITYLKKCYRSTLPITRLCNAVLPEGEKPEVFGREGEFPILAEYSEALFRDALDQWREDLMLRSIAVITRTQDEAVRIAATIPNAWLLTGDDDNYLPEERRIVVAGYHLMKGLEFDAVVVVWPDCAMTDDERRRLYTASSRALHSLCLLTDKHVIHELGIVM